MATSVIIDSKQGDKKLQRSLTYINPSATSEALVNFVEGLNGLSTNTLTGIRRVDTTDLFNDTRLPRNLVIKDGPGGNTITQVSYTSLNSNPEESTAFLIEGVIDGTAQVTRNMQGDSFVYTDWAMMDDQFWFYLCKGGTKPATGTITFTMPGNENYKPASISLTITE